MLPSRDAKLLTSRSRLSLLPQQLKQTLDILILIDFGYLSQLLSRMATPKPLTSQLSQRRMQQTRFSLDGRPMSSESFGTVRRKFLEAKLPEPSDADQEEERLLQQKMESNTGGKKKKKKKKVKEESLDPDGDERERERLQELKEWLESDADKSGIHHQLKIAMLRHMRVLDDLQKLKTHYYIEYMDALTTKVEDQRREIERKSEAQRKKRLRKERKQRETAKKVNFHMHNPEITTDNTFLNSLPKTQYHKIVVLQDHLMREGTLRRDEEVVAYWKHMGQPDNYRRIFGAAASEGGEGGAGTVEGAGGSTLISVTKPSQRARAETMASEAESQASDAVSSGGKSSSLGSVHPLDSVHTGSLANIQETREPSRPSSLGGPFIQGPKLLKKASLTLISRKPVHPKVLEMEQKCPRVEFPKLAAFTLDLEPPKEDPEVELMREEFQSRARLRNAEVRRLRKMYETSMSHGAATQRIIDRKDEFQAVLKGPSLGDVLHGQDPIHQLSFHSRDQEEDEEDRASERLIVDNLPDFTAMRLGSNPSRPTAGFAIERISEEGDAEEEERGDNSGEEGEREGRLVVYSSRSSSRRSSLTSTESEIRRNTPVTPEPKRPFPLTLDAVMDSAGTKVVNAPSSLWVNYGKFLPSVK